MSRLFSTVTSLVLLLTIFLFSVNTVLAQGAGVGAGATNCDKTSDLKCNGAWGRNQLETLVSRGIGLAVGGAFLALTIVIVISGTKILTSGGEAGPIQKAGGAITWAVLGILFLILAWLFLLLIKSFTGVDVTSFRIITPSAVTPP